MDLNINDGRIVPLVLVKVVETLKAGGICIEV